MVSATFGTPMVTELRRCKGIGGGPLRLGSGGRGGTDAGLAKGADAFYPADHFVTWSQETLRIACHAHSRGGAGEDDVAWQQRTDRRQPRHQLGYGEDH